MDPPTITYLDLDPVSCPTRLTRLAYVCTTTLLQHPPRGVFPIVEAKTHTTALRCTMRSVQLPVCFFPTPCSLPQVAFFFIIHAHED